LFSARQTTRLSKQALIIYHFLKEKSIKNEGKKTKNKKYSEKFEKRLAKRA
jgi:hypothetical protein